MNINSAHLILYVEDQVSSTAFYRDVLAIQPDLDVPGMTEFILLSGAVLGIMPIGSISDLLGEALPDLRRGSRIPRAELYLLVNDPAAYHQRALRAGAIELSPLTAREWGHTVAYSLDADGHVLAFANIT